MYITMSLELTCISYRSYHKVGASRELLASSEFPKRNLTNRVIICAGIMYTPAHVHYMEFIAMFMTEFSQLGVHSVHQCIALNSCICERSKPKLPY